MMNNNMLKKVTQIDEQLFLTLFNCNSPRWFKIMAFGLSKSGDGGLYILICLAVWWLSNNEQHQLLPVTILIGFAIERPIYLLAKNRFARIRPCDCLVTNAYIVPSDKFSLPSGHSAAAFLVAIILSHFFPEYALLLFSWATGVAMSRVVLGVHFPADIIIGATIGSFCGLFALALVVPA
ncbi:MULTISPECIES: phosphatase PAP2 family protein [Pseudoalteromonas]|uniref:undecaprenyl-diphosphate phosphatase n=3 Tax=root TaxID=1 RepID=A0A4P9J4V5_9GAMM|nr:MULTISPECIES: phosphatase PAP2 family protein [Pseudoalteromonas]KAA1162838.1 phosphatase PAP2 family protein [Pseudoalteromonas distincta]MDN3475663.1 phosphatase PAP2 family protein [Pseudoalteromonas sp. APC 3355]QCU76020.1 phosphatase PAP2 family protein [Pseudoalteromonas distincta]HDY92507.1 phosphatase PAP2 family protein [Pseudoalteromonas sp.]HDZ32690.1 phosphatase PAP2 family protein [Pseudoalteromonas sp.]